MEKILDDEFHDQKLAKAILSTINWWESKRIIFNILVGVAGLIPIFFHWGIVMKTQLSEALAFVVVYGTIVNTFYCLGWGIDILKWKYLNNSNFGKNKELIFLAGTFISVLATFYLSWMAWKTAIIPHSSGSFF